MNRLKALYVLQETAYHATYGPEERARIERIVDVLDRCHTPVSVSARPHLLAQVEVLISGWGGPVLDDDFLRASPRLRAVFYGAGSVAYLMTRAAWQRGMIVTTAQEANARPVAEYALAMIILSLKRGFRLARLMHDAREYPDCRDSPGCFRRTVGIVSLGATGRALLRHLRQLDLHIVAYDPVLTPTQIERLGAEAVTLAELFQRADVVSIHTPHLPETEDLITGAHLASMKSGAALINTARGALIREDELIRVARGREDLQFVLDVTRVAHPDPARTVLPPESSSPLYDLPNVLLTPHIAGSIGQECRRMGQCMVEELERYTSGRRLKWCVTPTTAADSSHRPYDMPRAEYEASMASTRLGHDTTELASDAP